MADHSFMPQVEVLSVTDTGRRRRWTDAEKLRVVEESFAAPRMASATARRYQISRSLLTRWRREAREGFLAAQQDRVHFSPVAVAPGADVNPAARDAVERHDDARSGRIEVVLANGRRLLADAEIEAPVLVRLVQVLERA